tara:strand:- start:525 stop:2924 length:2400 start_codon:yes stop_codon:yes gene_type:complete
MALFDTIRGGASGAGGGHEVERSLRFNASDDTRLTVSNSSNGDRQKWTWSGWVKFAHEQINDGSQNLFSFAVTGTNREAFYYGTNEQLTYQLRIGNSTKCLVNTVYRLRDFTAWYHIVLRIDTANSTSANRLRMYVNGQEMELFTFTTMSQSSNTFINSTNDYFIGDSGTGGTNLDGYMAEINFIDGQSLGPDSFAEEDTKTGQWNPILYTGSYGSNGFYLKFADNSNTTSSTLGKDSSGNGNNVSPSNFSVSAWPDNDSVTDTPTNNFATINILDKHNDANATNGNLSVNTSASAGHYGIYSTFGLRGGKWYHEMKNNGNNNWRHALMEFEHDHGSDNIDSTVGNNTSAVNKRGYGLIVPSGNAIHDSTTNSYGSGLSGSEVLMCAVDLDNGKIYWGKDGTWFNSGDPAAGSNPAFTGIDTDLYYTFAYHTFGGNNCHVNFGQQGFSHTPPSGFQAMCTANLPDPDIEDPTKHHETVLYSGNGSQRAVDELEFSPDLVWIKRRNASNFHILANTVSGAGKYLVTNTTDAESTGGTNLINGFNTNGFDVGTEQAVNNSSGTYASWSWNAGDSTVTNTSGSRTTQVRANQTCGFSILTFNYGSGTQTLGHGLGKPPKWILGKTLDNSTAWVIYHSGVGANGWFNLNTSPVNSGSAVWNNQEPTSTLINLGTGMSNQGDAIFFAWSEITGFSHFGNYYGNGSANGPYVHCGFRPAWVMYKNVSQNGGQWFIRDNKRETGNPNNTSLAAESSGSEVESSLVDTDFLANGFKLRETNEGTNNNNIQYIFMAFAEHPAKYARAV